MNYRQDIQVIRGVAVLLVVLFHLQMPLVANGFLGVDVFFVISGFLMAILYDAQDKKTFFIRRAKRLLPLYFAVVLLTIFFAFFLVTPSDFERVIEQSFYALGFSSNIGFWAEDSYFSKINFNPLLHLWSLGVEIQFYLLVPLIAFFIRLHKGMIWLLLLGSLALCLIVTGYNSKHSFFLTPFRIWEFLIGYLVASYFTNRGNLKYQHKGWLGLASLIGILIISALSIDVSSHNMVFGHPGLIAFVICCLTALILSFGLPEYFLKSIVGSGLETLGKYSYSIYLVHFPVITLFLYKPFEGTTLKASSVIDVVAILLLITVLSIVVFKWVEDSFRKSGSKSLKASLVSIGLIGGIAIAGQKLIHLNFTPQLADILFSTSDRTSFRCGTLFKITNPDELSCGINDVSSPSGTVFLIGNSHADSIKETFANIANDKNLHARFFVSNRPLLDARFSVDAILKNAQKHNANHLVFHYSETVMNNANIIGKVVDLANKAQSLNIKVSYLLPVPRWQQSVPKMLYLNQVDNSPLPTQRLHDVYQEYDLVYQTVASNKHQPVSFYDLAPIFCDNQCQLRDDNGKVLYFDSHHLTLSGAQKIAELLKSVI